jgi:putative ABC transport system ATP-binding protein
MARIRLERVAKRHVSRQGDVAGLLEANLTVAAGEFVAIRGRSGSGKSTLLGVVGLLERADAGRYLLDGQDVTRLRGAAASRVRGARLGFVFQSFQLIGSMSVVANVALPALYAGASIASATRRAEALLARFGLEALRSRWPAELSGGQRQMVAICRSLVNEPDVLVADEPTGSLDTASAERVMGCLLDLRRTQGRTILLATHDDALAQRADRVVRVADGRTLD